MSKKILIIEDTETNRMLLRTLLEHYNYQYTEAENGKDGIESAKKEIPDLILLDIQMPVMDGYEVLKELRKDASLKRIKVIAITSYALKGDKEKILAAGADDYISKPINVREFPNLIKKHIGPAD